MKISFITSECVPFVKTGGLADVSGALPKELAKLGVSINVFIPRYSLISIDQYGLKLVGELRDTKVRIGNIYVDYSLYHLQKDEVNFYFIDSQKYFDRHFIYTNDTDEDERFIFFQKSVLDILQKLKLEPDVIHLNDWQSALIPELINVHYKTNNNFSNVKTVLSIHNIAYQGIFNRMALDKANLPETKFFPFGPYEHYGNFNFLKIGIITSDFILTVSPTYAKEILSSEYGCGLEGVLQNRKNVLKGILNGIDETQWDPQFDKIIVKNYNYDSINDKLINKIHLLKYANADTNEKTPVIGIVSRLVWQKGFELMEPFIDDLLSKDVKVFVLGKGEYKYEEYFKNLNKKYPDKFFFFCEYNNELAHYITAGADIFLMPSRYEPCGLNQMYSLKYGTIPVVHKTGGLSDTVIDFEENPDNGNGFAFINFNSQEFYNKILKALDLYTQPNRWKLLQKNGMSLDFSWNKSAKQYLEIYNYLLNK
ncbi:MAG: glycogen synthase [Ignavibacteria bacterium]|nr:glycogen synthase [Ignavibacteria bacterium]